MNEEKASSLSAITSEENKPREALSEYLPEYSVRMVGKLYCIVNSRGQVVSNGYHEFKVFKHGDAIALLGQLGAMQKILKIPQTSDSFFEESNVDFHELRFDEKTGLLLAQTGA